MIYKGWSFRGRPFSQAQFNNSYLKINSKISYVKYLQAYARQWKNPRLRKEL